MFQKLGHIYSFWVIDTLGRCDLTQYRPQLVCRSLDNLL